MQYEARREGFLVSADHGLIDLDVVHGFLHAAYWCRDIPRELVRRANENSMVFGLYDQSVPRGTRDSGTSAGQRADGPQARPGRQIGFARVITDTATFAYLADVFVIEEYRGRGLSTWLIEVILAHPQLQGLRRFCLLTRDAHGLYEKFGFKPMPEPTRYMERWDPDVYSRGVR